MPIALACDISLVCYLSVAGLSMAAGTSSAPRAASDPINARSWASAETIRRVFDVDLAPRLRVLGPSMEISRARGTLIGGQSVPQSVVADRGVAARQKMLHLRRSIRTLSAKSPDGRQIRTSPSIRIVAENCPTQDIAALSPRPRTELAPDKKNPNGAVVAG
jgi:hypothetical protein